MHSSACAGRATVEEVKAGLFTCMLGCCPFLCLSVCPWVRPSVRPPNCVFFLQCPHPHPLSLSLSRLHIHIRALRYACTHTRTLTHVHTHSHARTYTHAQTHTHTHTHTRARARARTHAHTQHARTHAHKHTLMVSVDVKHHAHILKTMIALSVFDVAEEDCYRQEVHGFRPACSSSVLLYHHRDRTDSNSIRDGEHGTTTSTFTQLLSSETYANDIQY